MKNTASLGDEDLLRIIGRNGYASTGTVGLSDATAPGFRSTAIARLGDTVLILDAYLVWSCAFEEEKLTAFDEGLAEQSMRGDILCFLIDDTSGTYAYSIFSGGERVRVMSTTDGRAVADAGNTEAYESNLETEIDRMMETIDLFLGQPFGELTTYNTTKATAYYN